jgi:hypothetical protein
MHLSADSCVVVPAGRSCMLVIAMSVRCAGVASCCCGLSRTDGTAGSALALRCAALPPLPRPFRSPPPFRLFDGPVVVRVNGGLDHFPSARQALASRALAGLQIPHAPMRDELSARVRGRRCRGTPHAATDRDTQPAPDTHGEHEMSSSFSSCRIRRSNPSLAPELTDRQLGYACVRMSALNLCGRAACMSLLALLTIMACVHIRITERLCIPYPNWYGGACVCIRPRSDHMRAIDSALYLV